MVFSKQGTPAWRLCLVAWTQHLLESVLNCSQSMMQVRQHTEHKRTFMFLEQVILKYNAASTCINIKDIHEVGAVLHALVLTTHNMVCQTG